MKIVTKCFRDGICKENIGREAKNLKIFWEKWKWKVEKHWLQGGDGKWIGFLARWGLSRVGPISLLGGGEAQTQTERNISFGFW